MTPKIHLALIRSNAHASVLRVDTGITPEMLDVAEELVHVLTTGERLPPKVFEGLYDLCATAFGTSRDEAKRRLMLAMYGGKPDGTGTPTNDDAEMIAQWIEGYGTEPMDAAIVARAIRAGKWRAS